VDTQWPRFQVFLQERPTTPHQDVGSVHAADSELALYNARDVFVRRPHCSSLWVVPSDAIFSKTNEELKEWDEEVEETEADGEEVEPYYVFCKARPAGTQTYKGKVDAATDAGALRLAVKLFFEEPAPFVWWVFPARQVVESNPNDSASFFSPARDKKFRLSTDFHTHSMMKNLKKGDQQS
jgi:ring-1,2-phenylacetyl-CoA epoxidase subunit PaaB